MGLRALAPVAVTPDELRFVEDGDDCVLGRTAKRFLVSRPPGRSAEIVVALLALS